MEVELLIAAQIVRLFHQHPGVVWELIEASHPARKGDVSIRGADGTLVGYARRVVDGYECRAAQWRSGQGDGTPSASAHR
jgi:hypothetical protein